MESIIKDRAAAATKMLPLYLLESDWDLTAESEQGGSDAGPGCSAGVLAQVTIEFR